MANKALIEMATRHAIYLESLKAHNLKDYDDFLREMAKIIKARLGGEDLTAFARDRLERTLDLVAADLRTIASQASKTLRDQATDLAAYEAGFELKSLSGLTQAEFVLPTAAQLAAAVLYTPLAQIQGAAGSLNLEAAMKRWGDDVIAQVQSAIQGGYYRGETTDQIIRGILGTVKGRYSDGELARVKRDLESVVRTGLQHAANQARNQVWTNNSDIVKKWRFVATLDLKTSRQCQALDKTTWPLGQGPLPPLHYRCRSTSVAKLDDAFDMLEEGAERMARDPETGKSGLVDNKLSYYDWLKRQDLPYVQSVLGKDRAALLLKGGLSAERFAALQLDRQFQPMSLAKIAKMDEKYIHSAFRKAGLNRYLDKPGLVTGANKPIELSYGLDKVQQAAVARIFEAQATAKKAAQWAMDNDLADFADYTGVNAEVANEFNRSLFDHLQKYPQLREAQKFVGSTQAQYARWKQFEIERQLPEYLKLNPGETEDRLRKYLARHVKMPVVNPQTLATSWNEKNVSGITVNKEWGVNPDKFKAALAYNVETKFHPVGCDTIRSVVDHELGHQLDDLLGLRTDPVILKLWNQDKALLKDGLSGYGSKDKIYEMIAEGWAEYLNNPNPRSIAKTIGERIERLYKDKYSS